MQDTTSSFEAVLQIIRDVHLKAKQNPYWYQIPNSKKVKCFENVGTLDHHIFGLDEDQTLQILESAGLVTKLANKPMSIKTKELLKIAAEIWEDAVVAEKAVYKHGSGRNTFILIGGTDVNAFSLREQLSEEIAPPHLSITSIQARFQSVPSINRLITTIPDISDISDDDTLSIHDDSD